MKKEKLVKVQFYDPDVGYEDLWAIELSKGLYRIQSIPFFIYGVSRDDVVTASPDGEKRLQFGKVVKPAGNRTLRARSDGFIKNAVRRRKVIAHLKKLGSDVETLRSRLLSINVPRNIPLQAVTDYLTNDAKVSWEYANPENLNKKRTD